MLTLTANRSLLLTTIVALCVVARKPYTTPDETASAGVPTGWQVTSGAQTVIQLSGPQGVTFTLGNTVIAKNAAFQLGQKPTSGIDLSMPSAASLADKLTMILQ